MFSCARLETLWVFGPPDADLARFGALPGLRRLELSQGRKLVSTSGAGPGLEFLGLYQQGALSELRDLPAGLRVLAIENCRRIGSLDAVASSQALRSLKAANCGEIASLTPLRGLAELEEFFRSAATTGRA